MVDKMKASIKAAGKERKPQIQIEIQRLNIGEIKEKLG
jgi:hypothetical protein